MSPSTSRSRPRPSRNVSAASVRQLMAQSAEGAANPDGVVDAGTAGLLGEFAHHTAEETSIGDDDATASRDPSPSAEELFELEQREHLPWWKRPSPYWLVAAIPLTAAATSASIAPRVEIYTKLACRVHKPEYTIGVGTTRSWIDSPDGYGIPIPSAPTIPVIGGGDKVPMIAGNETIFTNLHGDSPTGAVEVTFGNEPSSTPDEENDPNRCAKDPVVEAAVAKLMTALTVSMGVLSCLTSAWWGAQSDNFGRARIMSITALGLLLNDLNFIFVAVFFDKLPGGYWLFLLGNILEGVLGGMAAAIAAIHAYVADCVKPADRSRFFSMFAGLMFVGVALGPTLGSLVIRTTRSTLSVFYFSSSTHFIYTLFVTFVLPETLTKAKMQLSRERAKRFAARLGKAARWRRVFAFAAPLVLFVPTEVRSVGTLGVLGPKRKGKDWSLTHLALCYAFTIMVMGSYGFKMQYAQAQYGWTSQDLGYFLSIISASRATYLVAILPVIIKIGTKWYAKGERSRSASSDPNHGANRSASTNPSRAPRHDPRFDLRLAQASLVLDVLVFLAIPLAPTAELFLTFSALACFGAGFAPAIQAVALELLSHRGSTETGKLFGAFSVTHALFGQIFGPAIFGFAYAKTAGTAPKTIFFITAGCVSISFLLSLFLRLPMRHDSIDAEQAVRDAAEEGQTQAAWGTTEAEREGTLVSSEDEPLLGRVSKRGRKSDNNALISS